MMEQVSWVPGLVAALVGLVAGVVTSLWLRGRDRAEPDVDMLREDLDERKAHLVTQLRELAEQQARMDPVAYAEQKAQFEAKAADVLRERSELEARVASPVTARVATPGREVEAPSPVVAFLRARPALRGAIWTVIVIGTGALLFRLVTSEQSARSEGGSLTGNSAPGGMSAAGGGGMGAPRGAAPAAAVGMIPPMLQGALGSSVPVADLMRRMQQNPNDVATLVAVAHELVRAERYDVADVVTQRALALQANNAEAQVHAAVIRASRGDVDGALAALETVLAAHPAELEGWIYRGLLALQRGDRKLAAQSFAAYVEHAPEGAPRAQVQALLTSLGRADG